MKPSSTAARAAAVKPIAQSAAPRSQLQQIIAGLTEGVILIDPDQTISWANEAALAMHGVDDVGELGADVSQYRERFQLRYRNNHPLSEGDYPIDRVIAGEAFSDVVVEVFRTGRQEPEWVHRVRSLVLTDAAGDPDCLVLVTTDVTEQFDAEERFEKAFNANPAPALICRLSDLRYIKVNEGFLQLTGYAREAVIGRSAYELDVLERAERRDLAKERLAEGRTIPQTESELMLPDGGLKLVILAGQPIEIGEESCMLFTFADLEPRQKAQNALAQSEERFAKAFRLAPVPMLIYAAEDRRITSVNDAFLSTIGYASEQVIGKTEDELELWADNSTRRKVVAGVEAGSLRALDVGVQTAEGHTLACLLSADTVFINGQACVLSVLQDVSERRHSESELVDAIESVMQDTTWFSRSVVERLANLRLARASNKPQPELAHLTVREREVLGLLCRGDSDQSLSEALGVTRNTVRNHIARIYTKIGVHRRGEVIVWARERGFDGASKNERAKRT